MATDQKMSLVDAEGDQIGSVIENELPAYRAISRLAVFSLIFGFLASFSFAHWFFYVFAIIAIVAGIAANVNIRRYPDILTGRGLASAGIAMGLVFGLSAVTVGAVQSYVRSREGEKFAKRVVAMLKAPNAGEAMWWSMHPDMRKDKKPVDYLHEIGSAKGKEKMMFDQRLGSLYRIRDRLAAAQGEDVHFFQIETTGIDDNRGLDLGIYAIGVFELEGPGSQKYPEKKEFAGAVMKARTKGPHYEWWVDDFIYPYKPRSFVAPDKPIDDGHGHAH